MNTAKRPSRGGGPRSSSTSGGSRNSSNTSGKRNFKKPGQRKGSSGGFSRSTSSRGGGRPSSGGRGGGSRGGGSRGGSRGGGSRGGGSRGGGGGGRRQPTFDPSQFINRTPVAVKEEVYVPKHKFNTFGLDSNIVRTLDGLGLTTPTPIQDQIIPEILNGNDVIGLAETGTGKTAAFLLPIIEKTLKDDTRITLIMAPTRELAIQINEELRKLSKGFKIFSTVCVGGININPQIKGLHRKNHFVIGTPGRLLDLIKQRHFHAGKIRTVVLDEADRMLDMGFIHDIRQILGATPNDRETLFFSATMDENAKKLVNDFMKNPVEVSVKKRDVTNSIAQDVVQHGHHNKFETLTNLLAKPEFTRVIIFGAMKHSVKKLAQELSRAGVKSESVHGNKSHGQKQDALKAFKAGNARVLVATDVAARGIHVDNVSHVINYDLPASFEDYVHRIGRTGRGEKRGKALTFVATRAPKDRV